MQRMPTAALHGGEPWSRAYGGYRRTDCAPSRASLKGFQSLLVSMQRVEYHGGAVRFRGTTTRRRVGSFIAHTICAQE